MPAPMGEEGPASVEAAVLLPVLVLVVALLVQPACLLYTRAVMSGAAAQTSSTLADLISDAARHTSRGADARSIPASTSSIASLPSRT